MGSPEYGRLVVDGKDVPSTEMIEHHSLVWSAGRRLLAAQELVALRNSPRTRVVVIDVERRVRIAASPPARGLSTPIAFDGDTLVYRHWDDRRGERELRLPLSQ